MKTSSVSTQIDHYRHQETYRVRYDDLDTYRHVNNKAFLSFIEDARVRYMLDAAGFRHHYTGSIGAMIVHASIDYTSQIQALEEVTVLTRTARFGSSSVTLHHLLLSGESGSAPETKRVSAVSTSVVVTMDLEANSPIHTPEDLVHKVGEWEVITPEQS